MVFYVIDLIRPDQRGETCNFKLGYEIRILVESFFQRFLCDYFLGYKIIPQCFSGFRSVGLSSVSESIAISHAAQRGNLVEPGAAAGGRRARDRFRLKRQLRLLHRGWRR